MSDAKASPPAKIRLREISEEDLPVFFLHQSDPEACLVAGVKTKDREAFDAHWSKILKNPEVFNRTIETDGKAAGYVACWEDSGERKIGYWLGKEFWGQGIASAALSEFLTIMSRRPLEATALASNVASLRILEKCGFVLLETVFEESEPGGEKIEVRILKLEGVL